MGEDCSTDKTATIVQEYAERNSQIRLLQREENVGPRENFVSSIFAARGEYIAFLDGDDYWQEPDKLAKQAEYLDSNSEVPMVFHSARRIFPTGECEVFPLANLPKKTRYSFEDILVHAPIPACSPMYRAKFLEGYNRTSASQVTGDFLLALWTSQHGDLGYIPEVMGVYRIHESGWYSSQSPVKQLEIKIRSLTECRNWADASNLELVDLHIEKLRCRLASAQAKHGYVEQSKSLLREITRDLSIAKRFKMREYIAALARAYIPFVRERI